MTEVLYGARLFDGRRMIEDAALVIEGGTIAAILPVADRPAAARDLGGGVLAPGLIDLQVNGGGGVLFNDTPTPEAIAAIAAAHRRDGTTGLLPTVITDAPAVLVAALAAAGAAHGRVPGALGIHVEGPFIDPARAGAHPPEHIRAMTREDAAALAAARAGAMLLTLAPVAAGPALIGELVRAGIIVSLGHAEATEAQAAACFAAGARAVTHLFNAMSPLGHRAPGLVGAALATPGIVCGLIADGHHVAPAAVRVALAARGRDGIALVSDAMPPAAGGPDRFTLQGRAVRRDGSRLVLADGTLAGAAITLMDAVRWLVRTLDVPIGDALAMASATPARLLGIGHRYGGLVPGMAASLVHLDSTLLVREVWVDGRGADRLATGTEQAQ